jgi:hypothetical protein
VADHAAAPGDDRTDSYERRDRWWIFGGLLALQLVGVLVMEAVGDSFDFVRVAYRLLLAVLFAWVVAGGVTWLLTRYRRD